MKKRPDGFLSAQNISHDSEQFDYIKELHEYLWKFVRCEIPDASGNIKDFIDEALSKSELRSEAVRTLIETLRKTKNKH